MSTETARLALSRERLRQALGQHALEKNGGGAPGTQPRRDGAFPLVPGFDALRQLWTGHPLRSVLHLANEAADAAVHPMAQRHPLRLVLGAGLVGALLAWSRPWRWILTPALVAGLLPRVMRGALGQIPRGAWMALLAAITRRPGSSDMATPRSLGAARPNPRVPS